MKHVPESDLIELAGGRLDADKRPAVDEHLPACPACRAKLADFRSVYKSLGAWEVAAGGMDLLPGVQAAVAMRRRRTGPWRRLVRGGLKAAAAILLAAGAGHLAARVGPFWEPAPPAPPGSTVERQAARSLHLAALADPSPVGLAEAVLNAADNHREDLP